MSRLSTYIDRKNRGVCTNCAIRSPVPGRVLCEICAEATRKRWIKFTIDHPDYLRDYLRKRRESLKNAGRCSKCGTDLSGEPSVYCTNCQFLTRNPGSNCGAIRGESKALVFARESKRHRVFLNRGGKIKYEVNKPTSPNEL